jgi:uncharacterized protein (DUF1810 family)
MDMNDPHNLQRFLDAQNPVYARVLQELSAGEKVSHWMWFIFPQLRGLGRSQMAYEFGIASREEAEAYLKHPVLGPRLVECTRLVLAVEGRSILDILGAPDDMKFRSSMTLFDHVDPRNPVFRDALRKYFGDEADNVTLGLLRAPH